MILGIGSSSKTDTKNLIIDAKILDEKINIWEKILKRKFENAKINYELKELRENINEIIENRKKKLEFTNSFKRVDESINQIENTKNIANLYFNQRQSVSGKLKSIIINDEEFEKIKREKLEKEYLSILEEIYQLKEEVKKYFFKFKSFIGSGVKK